MIALIRWMPRPTWRRLALLATLVAIGWLYQAYFTPEKRIARKRLSEADTKSEAAIDARLKPLADLFAKGRKGARAFAEEALSWSGKWQLLKGAVRGDDSHRQFLADAFARHVFSPEELREAMERAVRGYLDDVEGYEAEMLVLLRADLADPARTGDALPAHLRGDEAFGREYRQLAGRVVAELRLDVGVTIGRELGIAIASDLAAQVVLQAAKAAAAELGLNAGVLGTGAASTVATLGAGLVAAVVLDSLLDEVLKMAGYDPAAKIEALVRESLDRLEASLTRDGGTFSWHKTGALRERLEQLHESRSKMRREAIHRLLKEGGR
jgi:hypothetical protein